MAQGDMKAAMSEIANGAYWIIQPSAGEGWLIDRIGSTAFAGGMADVTIVLYDGSIETVLGGTYAVEDIAGLLGYPLQVYVNNTIYFRLFNNNGANRWLTYSGIQVK